MINGAVLQGRYTNLNQLLEREIAGKVRVQGTADPPSPWGSGAARGVLPIGVRVDGNAAQTADVDADTAAFRGESSAIQPGQTGTKTISIVATDPPTPCPGFGATSSDAPPLKTETTRNVRLPDTNPIQYTYDASRAQRDGRPDQREWSERPEWIGVSHPICFLLASFLEEPGSGLRFEADPRRTPSCTSTPAAASYHRGLGGVTRDGLHTEIDPSA